MSFVIFTEVRGMPLIVMEGTCPNELRHLDPFDGL